MQIFVINSKGGSGKTTIATHLASYYAQQGWQVTLVDRDIQKSASDWFQNRPKNLHPIQLICNQQFVPIKSDFQGVVINDMPAGFIPDIHSSLFLNEENNRFLIPILPSPTDIKAGLRFIMALYKSGLLEKKAKAAFIANRTRTNLRYHQTLVDFLERVDIPLIATLRDSQNYIRSMEHSISIFDLPGNSMKQDKEQWEPIFRWLHS